MRLPTTLLLAAFAVGCAAQAATPAAAPPPPPPAPSVVVVPLPPPTVVAVAPSPAPPAPRRPAAPPVDTTPVVDDPPPPRAVGLRPDGLEVTVLIAGSGRQAQAGDHLRVHYVGTLLDGSPFDSSRKKGRSPFTFILGGGSVIKGWEEGVLGMQVGEVRRLVLPPELAYGERGRPPTIPAHATLVFEVELLAIDSP